MSDAGGVPLEPLRRPAHRRAVEAPYVGPVGVVVVPPGFVQTPRRRAAGVRLAAALVLAVFAATVVATSVRSLGAWCLTTRAADTRGLPAARGG